MGEKQDKFLNLFCTFMEETLVYLLYNKENRYRKYFKIIYITNETNPLCISSTENYNYKHTLRSLLNGSLIFSS